MKLLHIHVETPAERALRRLARVLCLAASLVLTACGGWWDDPPAAEISGVAATGAAIVNGQVLVVNANGESVRTRTDAAGRYGVFIGDAPPFMLSVQDGSGGTWYSYAAGSGTAHISPLTTLAMLQANAGRPLADLLQNWRSRRPSDAQVLEAAKAVNANLRSLMGSAGVDADRVNIFTESSFAADHTGLDAVLDAMRVSLSCSATACERSITSPAGSVLVRWNGEITTTGITVSWAISGAGNAAVASGGSTGGGATATSGGSGTTTGSVTVGLGSCKAPVPGTWSMVVQTTVSGLGAAAIPEVCIDGLPGAPANQAEFCNSGTTTAQLPPGVSIVSCSFSGSTGTIAARITSPLVIDYSVTYTFIKR